MLTYLFRIDGAKDNDAFFDAMRQSVSHVYAGIELRIGSEAWVPDLVKIAVPEPPDHFSLTLIELEATKSAAKIACRKYQGENPEEIFEAFIKYLDRVIRQCRSNADDRESKFVQLKKLLSQANNRKITTAGALRSSANFVEEWPLYNQPNDQPKRAVASRQTQREPQEDKKRPLYGKLNLTQEKKNALSRCVLILDAVIRERIREHHHSSATLHAWRPKSPLKRLLFSKDGHHHPELHKLILENQNRSLTLDFEKALLELAELWSPLAQEQIRTLIDDYFPIGSAVKKHDRMDAVFDEARKHVSSIQDKGLRDYPTNSSAA